ncbi:hypothetical protein [Flavobacterium sp. GT3R68]|uniref:hypothetical protein n=1 Tax=Flavobacterium sp. GT3R68 TaxID=2594437 RepID=UPI000F8985FB|nr:hypothetical protein [Flavobacterium sp. GT3R68]RTY95968.1 hypothetical protein EKL32_04810 [Flavobacterium sp. GSN2]TRW93741.1 hypothetical protein FNW07_02200 [Flavobacterium sp. GT3R68]
MRKTILLLFIPVLIQAQVGIGTVNPQADLHIAGTTSTIRIESLNSTNQPILNTGSKLAPAFVTAEGDITVSPSGYSTGIVAGSIAPLNFLLSFDNFIPDGPFSNGVVVNSDALVTLITKPIYTVPFTSPQSALIEVKYGITIVISSTDLDTPPYGTTFTDLSARSFRVYFCIDLNNNGLDATELSKRYGVKGQAYASASQGSLGYPYMNSQGYANIPAGNHSLKFFGEVEDAPSKYTSVGFGGAQDFLKLRIYN